ncbi:ventral anterior homeobox 2b-like [Acanthaster planci]|uniref:Ventral anterior homeobox 2b-like n=1 Tax=Acanthaster planci TaxID=133434 RepID=A0A8B7XJ29_ACAPL|nr:ventral anterior homeobox 2b-like [Acanthaster planci]
MEMWAQSYWPAVYDYHSYDIYDKMHHYRQVTYQQLPVYRVPPVFRTAKTTPTPPSDSHSSIGSDVRTASPHRTAEFPRLDGSFDRQRCRVSAVDVESVERTKETRQVRCGSLGAGDGGKTEASSRRESTPHRTGNDTPDTHSFCRVLTFQDPNGRPREMVFPKALDLDRPKRARTSFTSYQLEQLEKEFKCNQYMVGRDRARLATNLDLTETQVKVWFQNRRTKFKREQCKAAEFKEKNAESIAACNILKLLQSQQGDTATVPSVGSVSPIRNRLMTSW